MGADYPRVTHPCATLLTTKAAFAFDLHVLSTPPAFNLSQNQTLQFKSVSQILLAQNQNSSPLAIHLSMNNLGPRGFPQKPRAHLMHSFLKLVNPSMADKCRKVSSIHSDACCQHIFNGGLLHTRTERAFHFSRQSCRDAKNAMPTPTGNHKERQ